MSTTGVTRVPSRRQALVGLASLLAGGSGIIGSDAFSTQTDGREQGAGIVGEGAVSLELDPIGSYATRVDGAVRFSFTGAETGALNRNALSVFGDQLAIRNRGDAPVFVCVGLREPAWVEALGAIPFLSTPAPVDVDGSALVGPSASRRVYPLGGHGLNPEDPDLPVGAVLQGGESLACGLLCDVDGDDTRLDDELTVRLYGVPRGSGQFPGVFEAASEHENVVAV